MKKMKAFLVTLDVTRKMKKELIRNILEEEIIELDNRTLSLKESYGIVKIMKLTFQFCRNRK